jgi:hypothetical protein
METVRTYLELRLEATGGQLVELGRDETGVSLVKGSKSCIHCLQKKGRLGAWGS